MSNNIIKFNVIGKILEGEKSGWFILLKKEFENSGGYTILFSKDRNMNDHAEGYDYWAENEEVLQEIAQECKWKIHWFE